MTVRGLKGPGLHNTAGTSAASPQSRPAMALFRAETRGSRDTCTLNRKNPGRHIKAPPPLAGTSVSVYRLCLMRTLAPRLLSHRHSDSSLCRSAWVRSVLLLAVLLAMPWLGWAANSAVVSTPQVRAELVAHAPQGLAPGKTAWLGLLIEHAPHWHTYWKNSGDSGIPTSFTWT